MLRITSIVLFCLFFIAPAEARHRHNHHHRHHVHHSHHVYHKAVSQPGQVVAHPEGCPHVAFCGCGASIRIFGHSVRPLWLAANWFRFPRAAPAPGMAAVRPHHVMVLEADLGSGVWQVYDANSGGHATRIHARSIAGWTIVNPQGSVEVHERRIRTARSHRGTRAIVRGYGQTNPTQQGLQVRRSVPFGTARGGRAVFFADASTGRSPHFLEHHQNARAGRRGNDGSTAGRVRR